MNKTIGRIEAKLYQILDDIDTASDVFKDDLKGFQSYTLRRISDAHAYIHSPDGYTLKYTNEYTKELARVDDKLLDEINELFSNTDTFDSHRHERIQYLLGFKSKLIRAIEKEKE